jgi:hypothetical protein
VTTAPAWGFELSPTNRAVLAHGLTGPPEDAGAPALTDPHADDDWAALRGEASHHRLDGLLVAAVVDGLVATTVEQRAELAHLELDLTRARMWHEQRLVTVVDDLEAAGIEVRVLKGPALAALDYPDAQLRPTGDIDLLVHGEQIDHAVAALVAMGGIRTDPDPVAGYAGRVGKGATIAMPDGLEVDLHRLLVWGPLGVRMPPAALWEPGRTFERGGRAFETLDVETTLLHACAHLLVLGWRRALTLRDVAQVLANPGLDPDRAIRLARRTDAEALLATGVLLAQRELDLADAAWGDAALVLQWARGFAPRWRDRLWLRVERPEDPIGALEAFGTYLELPGPAERRILRAATLRPEPGTFATPGDRATRVVRRSTARWRRRPQVRSR